MKKFSIVIPCYNSFSLMTKCLKSLEEQTVKDFEVIVIDDCSTDNSYEKLLEYKEKTSLTMTLEKTLKNAGPGEARNLGIEKASGTYIFMLDADDYIANNTVELLNTIIEKKQCDCIFFDYYLEKENILHKRSSIEFFGEGEINKSDALIYSSGSTFGKVYRLNIIKENYIKYPKLMRNEDMPFNKIAISYCNSFYYLKSYLYYYVMQSNSLMHNKKLLDENNAIKAFEYIKNKIGEQFQNELEAIFIKEYFYATNMILLEKGCTTKKIKENIEKTSNMYPNWHQNKSIAKYSRACKNLS